MIDKQTFVDNTFNLITKKKKCSDRQLKILGYYDFDVDSMSLAKILMTCYILDKNRPQKDDPMLKDLK